MTRTAAAAACFFASVALAQTSPTDTNKMPGAAKAKPATNEVKGTSADSGGMAGWTPRKVTHEDKKGIEAMLKQNENAWMKGDIAATASMVDFPVYMVTDDSKGNVTTSSWTREQYMATMTESMKNMPKDFKVKHNFKYNFITDDIATVHDSATMTMGKQTMNIRNAELVIKKEGRWMIKSMIEGGWGDSMKAKMEPKG